MKFIKDIDKERYKKFYLENNGHFMQSYAWGQFNVVGRSQIPHYVGMESKGELLCAALLLEKKGPFGLSYFYCPRGYIIDYKNTKLLKEFTNSLKEYIKEFNGIYLKVDPEIIYHQIDTDGNVIKDGVNNYKLFNDMLSLGYKHTGFVNNFENNQPRFTFKISLEKDLDDVYKNIHKSIMKKVKKTYDYDMKFRESNDVDTFYKLISKTSEKDNFDAYSYDYYKNACTILGNDNIYKLFELYINPKKLYSDVLVKLNEIIDKINNTNKEGQIKKLEESKNRLIREKEILDQYKEKDELVICSQICAMNSDTLWTLYIGNDDIGRELYCVNRMYIEVIRYAKEEGYKYLDLFGTVGDINNTHGNLSGIHKFKLNFGGEYTEFIGEFDLINKPFLYKILPVFLKIYRKLLKLRRK